jgi:putative membrane protein
MTALLKEGRLTEAILGAIQKVGDVLATHFPRDPDDQDELPDRIVRD